MAALKRVSKNQMPIPEPPVSHVELTDDDLFTGGIFIIGDIHGCYSEFKEIVLKVHSRSGVKNPLIILCGDLVNKGSGSIEVLRYAKSHNILAVRGNHDDRALREYFYRFDNNILDMEYTDKLEWLKHVERNDMDYLISLPYTISIPKFNVIIVHAGLIPGIPLSKQTVLDMTKMRELQITTDGTYIPRETAPSDGSSRNWAEVWKGPEMVVFGHDAVRGFRQYPHAVGLDSGCVYGRYLTGLLIHPDHRIELETVKAKSEYSDKDNEVEVNTSVPCLSSEITFSF